MTPLNMGKKGLRSDGERHEADQISVKMKEGADLSEQRERTAHVSQGDPTMMKIQSQVLNTLSLERTDPQRLGERNRPFPVAEERSHGAIASLGLVLIISRDGLIRDFLGQMLRLLGYDCKYFEELTGGMMDQSWKRFDALFIDSQFLEQFKSGQRHGASSVQDLPLVVVLGDPPQVEESGGFRVLNKPLDYRQMGRVMDECMAWNTQSPSRGGI